MSMRYVYSSLSKDEKKMAREILESLKGLPKMDWLLALNTVETARTLAMLKEVK